MPIKKAVENIKKIPTLKIGRLIFSSEHDESPFGDDGTDGPMTYSQKIFERCLTSQNALKGLMMGYSKTSSESEEQTAPLRYAASPIAQMF